jgi:hypothetical protein
MILALNAGTEHFAKEVAENVEKFFPMFSKIIVRTNFPMPEFVDKVPVGKLVFSYMDPVIFAARLSNFYKSDVFYCHADKLSTMSDYFIKNFIGSKQLLTRGTWNDVNPEWTDESININYFKPFKAFLDYTKFDEPISAFREEWIYYPRVSDSFLSDLEIIKPVIEYNSLVGHSEWKFMGNGEGLALGYAIAKNNIDTSLFIDKYFL